MMKGYPRYRHDKARFTFSKRKAVFFSGSTPLVFDKAK
jgi:hypothetical protein